MSSTTPTTCPLLALPPELRLQIYTHLFTFSSPIYTSYLLRGPTNLELICPARKAHAAILRTCKTIRHEATSLLYDSTTFRFQIYPEDGFPAIRRSQRVLNDSAPFLRWVRRVEIKAAVLRGGQAEGAVRLLAALCRALEDAGANLVAVRVFSNFFLGRKEGEIVRRLSLTEDSGAGRNLFRKVLDVVQEGDDGMVKILEVEVRK